jgi:hypothetical protein
MGRKWPGPQCFASWAATWRRNTRAAEGCHTEDHRDQMYRINCARESKDLMPDTGTSGTVRMSDRRWFRVILDFVEVSLKDKDTDEKKPETFRWRPFG